MTSKKRIGDLQSIVKPGDPIPGKPGHFYETGMFAPSPETLSSLKLQESKNAGLLPILDLDVYNKNGEFDINKIEKLDFLKILREEFNIDNYNSQTPSFALLGFIAAARNIEKKLFWYFKIKYLDWVADPQFSMPDPATIVNTSITDHIDAGYLSRTLVTGYAKMGKEFIYAIFQPFFNHLSTPILPGIQNISTGLSVASSSIFKTIGYILFERLSLMDEDQMFKFLDAAGWKQAKNVPKADIGYFYRAGEEVGVKKNSIWFRDARIPPASVLSTFSPKESFSEAFLYHYVHREFLRIKCPNLHEYMGNLENFIKSVI